MNTLAARDALTIGVKRVSAEERPRGTASIFAVFENDEPDALWLGIVTAAEVIRFPQRIFADLLPARREAPVLASADIQTVIRRMEGVQEGALSVVDEVGGLVGVVTRESLWTVMLEQQQQMVAAAATREAQQRTILQAIPDDLLYVSAGGELLESGWWSDNTRPVDRQSLWPHAYEESVGKHLTDVFPEDVAATLLDGVRRTLASDSPNSASFRISEEDGGLEYEARFAASGDDNVLVICRNVSEVNALRAKLVLTDRMVALGTLAAGVAHELNNPLTFVLANLEFLSDLLIPGTSNVTSTLDAATLLDEMREGLLRVRTTVGELKTFSRTDANVRTQTDVLHVLDLSLNLARNEIRHRARLTRDFGPVPSVHANDGQLGQVFLNLLINAAQAIPEGAAATNEVRVSTSTNLEGCAVIEIRDTGAGFSEEIEARIFEPFFSTKPAGIGTGLGLSICHGIVISHGGRIEVESAVGQGSVFRVVLPGSGAYVSQTRSSLPPSPGKCPVGRFLVVDDELLITKAYRRLLGDDQCTACTSASKALALLQQGQRFDAILCDLMMPDTSGVDFYEALLREVPEQAKRIIFVTGGAFTDRARSFVDGLTNPVISKPLDVARLYQSIKRVIETNHPV